MLELKNIVHYYKGVTGSVQSLFKINLEIPRGEIVGLFGEMVQERPHWRSVFWGFYPTKERSCWTEKQ